MMSHRAKKFIGILLLAIGLVLTGPGMAAAEVSGAPADVSINAWETDYAKKHSMTSTNKYCYSPGAAGQGFHADICWQPYGDYLWIRDGRKDNHRVKVLWSVQAADRRGECVNKLGVDAGWTRCNKDFPEGQIVTLSLEHYWNGEWEIDGWYMFGNDE